MICRNTGAVLCHAMNLFPFFGRRCFVFQIIYIPVVHTDYQIKMIEIFYTDGARTMHQLITATSRVSTHPAVRQFALMIRQDSGGIYHKLFFQSRFFYQMKHHAFSRRATADISKADKQYLFHNFSFNRFKNKSNDNFAECPERA